MADESYLGVLGSSDLANFNQSVVQSDPYNIASKGLASWSPDYSSWSPTEVGVTSFAKSFLSGLLGNYAQQNAANQLNSVISVLPQLREDPLSVATPEGVDAAPFSVLRANSALKYLAAKDAGAAEKKKEISTLMNSIFGEGIKNETIDPKDAIRAIQTGNYSSILNKESADTSENPNSKAYKVNKDEKENLFKLDSRITDARDYLKTVGGPYITARENLDLLTKNFKESNPATDLIYAIAANKILDPSAIVRADDIQNIQGIIPYLEKSISGFRQYVTPTGTISPEGKAVILQTIAPKIEALGNNYKGLLENESNRVKLLGADPALISAAPYRPYDLNSLIAPKVDLGNGASASQSQIQSIIAEAKAKYGDTPEGKAAAQKAIQMLGTVNNTGRIPLG